MAKRVPFSAKGSLRFQQKENIAKWSQSAKRALDAQKRKVTTKKSA